MPAVDSKVRGAAASGDAALGELRDLLAPLARSVCENREPTVLDWRAFMEAWRMLDAATRLVPWRGPTWLMAVFGRDGGAPLLETTMNAGSDYRWVAAPGGELRVVTEIILASAVEAGK